MSDVECAGPETNISDCGHVMSGTHRCDHSLDISVSCLFDSAEEFAGRNTQLYSSNDSTESKKKTVDNKKQKKQTNRTLTKFTKLSQVTTYNH